MLTPPPPAACWPAEGASYHCQPLARELTEQRMLDWLDEQID